MKFSLLYSILLIGVPVLAFALVGWLAALVTLGSSILATRLTKGHASTARRMICIALIVNQLVILHSYQHYYRNEIRTTNLSKLSTASSDEHVPFVSIVVVSDPALSVEAMSASISQIQDSVTKVLVREIVIPEGIALHQASAQPIPFTHSISNRSDFVVFVKPGFTLSADWLNGFVREYISNDMRLVVPVVALKNGNRNVASAIIGSDSGRTYLLQYNVKFRDVPIIPFPSALGASTKLLSEIPNISSLFSENRMVELSLRAWFCADGITFSRFTTLSAETANVQGWRELEGDNVDERITGCPRGVDWFFEKFKEDNPETKRRTFQIANANTNSTSTHCLRLLPNMQVDTANPCDAKDPAQLFQLVDDGHIIKSVGQNEVCLDAGSASKAGQMVKAYNCQRGNRNQYFSLIQNRLMWGSFCAARKEDNAVMFDNCSGLGTSVAKEQMFTQHFID